MLHFAWCIKGLEVISTAYSSTIRIAFSILYTLSSTHSIDIILTINIVLNLTLIPFLDYLTHLDICTIVFYFKYVIF